MIDLQKFRKDFKIKQKDLKELFKVSQPYISQIESFEKPLPGNLLEILLNKYGKVIYDYIVQESPDKNSQNRGVPYYDIDINATITTGFDNMTEVPDFYVDFKPFNDCSAYLPVYGNSMYPEFANGEIIAVKKLNNKEIIQWGEAHLVITDEEANSMKTLKLVLPHDEPDKLILRSVNPLFSGDTIIPKSSIINLYIVKGKITRKLF